MNKKPSYQIMKKSLNLSALMMLFCVIGLNVSGWSNTLNIRFDTEEFTPQVNSQSSLHSADYCVDSPKNSSQLPLESSPISSDQEEETNKENQDDNNWNGSNIQTSNNIDFEYKRSYVYIVQFEKNVLNRPRISLFILYHSWKSFLS